MLLLGGGSDVYAVALNADPVTLIHVFQGQLFASVVQRHSLGATILTQACPGWVELVEAAVIEGDAGVALLQGRDLMPPLIGEAAQEMHEDDGRAAAHLYVAQCFAVDGKVHGCASGVTC